MDTLAEIEAAVPKLNVDELERLERRLRELRHDRSLPAERPPTNLMQFSGVLKLSEDPLTWQRRVREEWR